MMLKNRFIKQLTSSFIDLLPIVVVVLVFQILVIRQPVPEMFSLIMGAFFVILGLTLFILGLQQSLFPLGESMAHAFARKGSVFWLMLFAFCIGFGASIAEPGLITISKEAARMASERNILPDSDAQRNQYALSLRFIIAFSIGLAVLLGVLKIIKGWPTYYFVLSGYTLVAIVSFFAPPEIIGFAFDAGGIATSTITVPLVIAIGVGLAAAIKGRHPITDGFGLIALAAVTSTVFVLLFGILR